MRKNVNIKLLCLCSVLIFVGMSSCKTAPSNSEETSIPETDMNKRLANLEETLNHLKFQMSDMQQENMISKKLLASIQNDLQSQNEELSTQKKNLAILNRGLRSGVFEELPEDKANNAAKSLTSTMLPDFVEGRSGFSQNSNPSDMPLVTSMNKEDPVGPKELLAHAEIKIRKAEFKEGLNKIDELKKKFPNFDDNGRSYLLSAEAWLKLREFNNVIPELRSFYLRYPTSADLAYAKLLEGQANEGIGSFEKAAELYNEVISLSPQSTLAQTARDGMLRMRDQK